MRYAVTLGFLFLTGCQSLALDGATGSVAAATVMPAWERYRLCTTAQEPAVLLDLAGLIAEAAPAHVEPPGWMKPWSAHVTRQPIRTSVDPAALELACLIHVASRLMEQQKFEEARVVLERVVTRQSSGELDYYIQRAKQSLVSLPQPALQTIALRSKAVIVPGAAVHD